MERILELADAAGHEFEGWVGMSCDEISEIWLLTHYALNKWAPKGEEIDPEALRRDQAHPENG